MALCPTRMIKCDRPRTVSRETKCLSVDVLLQTLWLERTTIYTKFTFPGILCWFETTHTETVSFFFYLRNLHHFFSLLATLTSVLCFRILSIRNVMQSKILTGHFWSRLKGLFPPFQNDSQCTIFRWKPVLLALSLSCKSKQCPPERLYTRICKNSGKMHLENSLFLAS